MFSSNSSWCTHGLVAAGLALQLGVAQQLLPQRTDDLVVNGHMMRKVSGERFVRRTRGARPHQRLYPEAAGHGCVRARRRGAAAAVGGGE